jgi:hypothetical protein
MIMTMTRLRHEIMVFKRPSDGRDLVHIYTSSGIVNESFAAMIKRRGSIMPAILDLLYREYCRARLTEMRKQLLIRAESRESLDANCDANHPDGAADRRSALEDWQHKADERPASTKRSEAGVV